MSVTDRVASNIRAEMARRRVSQREVAERLGVSQQSLSYRLTGRTPFDVGELAAIADVLGVTAASLLGEPETASAVSA